MVTKSHIKTHFLHFIAKKLGIYLVETNIYCTFATANKERHNLIGVLVQLVRIHACHAWGHEFEPRTHRQPMQSQASITNDVWLFSYTHTTPVRNITAQRAEHPGGSHKKTSQNNFRKQK